MNCDCQNYDDLPLDLDAISVRVGQFRKMRPLLKQIGQKMVVRWQEHHRLYRCAICGQIWQATLAPRDSDSWYLFKVPKISIKAWKQTVFVPPGEIAVFLADQGKFLSNAFETSTCKCNDSGCSEFAIVGSVKCIYHQFLQIGAGETLRSLKGMRWFGPYSPDMLQANNTLQPTRMRQGHPSFY